MRLSFTKTEVLDISHYQFNRRAWIACGEYNAMYNAMMQHEGDETDTMWLMHWWSTSLRIFGYELVFFLRQEREQDVCWRFCETIRITMMVCYNKIRGVRAERDYCRYIYTVDVNCLFTPVSPTHRHKKQLNRSFDIWLLKARLKIQYHLQFIYKPYGMRREIYKF